LKSLFVGRAGMASPSEWFLAGFLLTSTGLLLVSWRPDNRFSRAVAEMLPGLIVSGWLGYLALSLTFGSIPGLDLSFY